MSAVLLAVFNDYAAADRTRTELVLDGFPTDRVELTASCEPGRAGLEPGATLHDRWAQYFRALFQQEPLYAERLAGHLDHGAATVTVHPRGTIEVERATEILGHAGPTEILKHDLAHQGFEHAAARHGKAWVRHLWVDLPPEPEGESHCIYCRLFERRPASPGH